MLYVQTLDLDLTLQTPDPSPEYPVLPTFRV